MGGGGIFIYFYHFWKKIEISKNNSIHTCIAQSQGPVSGVRQSNNFHANTFFVIPNFKSVEIWVPRRQ